MPAALCSCGSYPNAGHGNSDAEGPVTMLSADFASIFLHLLKKYKGPTGREGTGDCWWPGPRAVAGGGNKERHWAITPAGHLPLAPSCILSHTVCWPQYSRSGVREGASCRAGMTRARGESGGLGLPGCCHQPALSSGEVLRGRCLGEERTA